MLSLKLGELAIIKEETGEDAILLLDDVLSELDADRQRFLLESLMQNQLLLTVADLSGTLLEKLPHCRVITIEEGTAKG